MEREIKEAKNQVNLRVNWGCKVIPNFKLKEIACGCGCGLVILQMELLFYLSILRTAWDSPIIVESWCRCDEWNKLVGGVEDSYHCFGKAVDIRPENGNLKEFLQLCVEIFPYVLEYETFNHCDIRGERSIYSRKENQPDLPFGTSNWFFDFHHKCTENLILVDNSPEILRNEVDSRIIDKILKKFHKSYRLRLQ